MWKISFNFSFKRNMKKHVMMFALIPTVVYLSGIYNRKTEHSINFVWLFFVLELTLKYEY